MARLAPALREICGLFVDDGRLALAVIAWLTIAWLLLPRLDLPTAAKAPILFAGLALILLESAWRRPRA